MKTFVTAFCLGTFIGFFGVVLIVNKKKPIIKKETVLAATLPTESPSPTPTDTPEPTSVPTIKPRPSPTLIPSPVPTNPPTGEPTATPDVWSPPDIEPIMARYAGQYGVDKNILERIANCESHFNPIATNGDYLGMFQFSTNTWIAARQQIGGDINPSLRSNIEESIKTAAYLLSKGGTSPWPLCLR